MYPHTKLTRVLYHSTSELKSSPMFWPADHRKSAGSGSAFVTFRPITYVRRTLLKTEIHLKGKSYPIYLGHVYRRRLYHRYRDQLPAVTLT